MGKDKRGMAKIDLWILPGQWHFTETEHGFFLVDLECHVEANSYFFPSFSETELLQYIAADHESWQWQVIGNFGTSDEALFQDLNTGKIYLYNWVTYPNDQQWMADHRAHLLERLAALDGQDSYLNLFE